MTGFVARLYMQIHEITVFQGFYRRLGLAFVIRIVQTGSPFHIYDLQTGITSDTPYEVYGGNDRTLFDLRISLRQRNHGRTVAAAPRPNTVGRIAAFLHPADIQRVVGQQPLRLQNQAIQQVCGFLGFGYFGLHHTVTERRTRHVVRRSAMQMLVPSFDDQ